VELKPEDDRGRLSLLKLRLTTPARRRISKFLQPCSAYKDCKCAIYSGRPTYCREFECLLLKKLRSGDVEGTVALRVVQETRQKLGKIDQYLAQLGNTDYTSPHRERFNQIARRMNQRRSDPAETMVFSKLTIAFHELNLELAKHFYPGATY
jgi:Fe-S-cluster containining protein